MQMEVEDKNSISLMKCLQQLIDPEVNLLIYLLCKISLPINFIQLFNDCMTALMGKIVQSMSSVHCFSQ